MWILIKTNLFVEWWGHNHRSLSPLQNCLWVTEKMFLCSQFSGYSFFYRCVVSLSSSLHLVVSHQKPRVVWLIFSALVRLLMHWPVSNLSGRKSLNSRLRLFYDSEENFPLLIRAGMAPRLLGLSFSNMKLFRKSRLIQLINTWDILWFMLQVRSFQTLRVRSNHI